MSGAPLILGTTWAEATLATIAVGLRLYCALKVVRKVEWDLFWVIMAWCSMFASQVILSLCPIYGLGSIGYVPEHEFLNSLRWLWIGQIVSAVGAAFARIAIIAMLLRTHGEIQPKGRWFLHAAWTSNVIVGALQVGVAIKACPPGVSIAGGFDRALAHAALIISYVQATWAAASDLFLATYAVVMFRGLRLSKNRKTALSVTMGGGYVVAVAAILRLVYLPRLRSNSKPLYDGHPLIIWTYTEVWLILILGSLSRLHSLCVILKHKVKSRKGSSSSDHGVLPHHQDLRQQQPITSCIAPWPEPATMTDVGVLPPVSSTDASTMSWSKHDANDVSIVGLSLGSIGLLPSISDAGAADDEDAADPEIERMQGRMDV